jgi:hypothetical protein
MSIYPVRITEWYDDPKNAFHAEREMLKTILKYTKCECCKKSIKWQTGYVMHSITFGYGEAWCTKKCLVGKRDSQPK